jgi:tyrosyl-tRNA synthetase
LGDFTARVGDPSGKSETRPRLSKDEVDGYAERLLQQFRTVLSSERLEVRHNSEWLETMDMEAILRLTASTTVARMLERDDFAKRYAANQPISLTEFMYPLLQGYDSVAIEADVELGGTDQLFNLIMGRHLQTRAGQEPQVVLTTPLLVGLDGEQKMSKSLGNYVGISEPPGEQFGKVMSIPDALMPRWFQLTTGWLPDRVDAVTEDLRSGALAPVAAKRLLARTIVDLYHGDGAGEAAEAEFDRVFRDHAVPSDVAERQVKRADLPTPWFRLLPALDLASSGKDARRKIEQGAVRLDQEKVTDPDGEVDAGDVDGRLISVGKRAWARVRVTGER